MDKLFQLVSSNTDNTDKFLARQTMNNNLPKFDGNPLEWPNFLAEYRRSTDEGGFTNVENTSRLQKSLHGKARETVVAMFMVPDNAINIIKILEMRFGRPDFIIKTLIEKAQQMMSPKNGRLDLLIDFSNMVRNLVITMKTLKTDGHMRNPQLIEDLVSKLPDSLILKWGNFVYKNGYDSNNLEDFSYWLDKLANAASFVSLPRPKPVENKTTSNFIRKKKETVLSTKTVDATSNENIDATDQKHKCTYCSKTGHAIAKCPEFLDLTTDERWKWIIDNRYCFYCLRHGHSLTTCRKKKTCGINGCKKKHKAVLHNSQANETNQDEVVLYTQHQNNEILLRVLPVTLHGPINSVSTFALLDEASTTTLLDEDVANNLGLTGKNKPLHMQWATSQTKTDMTSKSVSL